MNSETVKERVNNPKDNNLKIKADAAQTSSEVNDIGNQFRFVFISRSFVFYIAGCIA